MFIASELLELCVYYFFLGEGPFVVYISLFTHEYPNIDIIFQTVSYDIIVKDHKQPRFSNYSTLPKGHVVVLVNFISDRQYKN